MYNIKTKEKYENKKKTLKRNPRIKCPNWEYFKGEKGEEHSKPADWRLTAQL